MFVPPKLTLDGVSLQVIPVEGDAAAASITVPAKPLDPVTVTVVVAAEPASTGVNCPEDTVKSVT